MHIKGYVKNKLKYYYLYKMQVKGKITGQTLLPMPMGIEEILDEQFNSKLESPKLLQVKNNIEEIVIKWATQINEILNVEFSKFSTNEKEIPVSGNLLIFQTISVYSLLFFFFIITYN